MIFVIVIINEDTYNLFIILNKMKIKWLTFFRKTMNDIDYNNGTYHLFII